MENISVTYENCENGDRVVRGKNWHYDDQDEDSEYGVIVQKDYVEGWAYIEWQNGQTYGYRIGKGAHDLYFYTEKPTNSFINRFGHLIIKNKQR